MAFNCKGYQRPNWSVVRTIYETFLHFAKFSSTIIHWTQPSNETAKIGLTNEIIEIRVQIKKAVGTRSRKINYSMTWTRCEFQLQVLAAANRVYKFFFVGRGAKSARTHTNINARARANTHMCSVAISCSFWIGGGVGRGCHVLYLISLSFSRTICLAASLWMSVWFAVCEGYMHVQRSNWLVCRFHKHMPYAGKGTKTHFYTGSHITDATLLAEWTQSDF